MLKGGGFTNLAQPNEGPFDKKGNPGLGGGGIGEILNSLAGCQVLDKAGWATRSCVPRRIANTIRYRLSYAKIKFMFAIL